MTRGHATARAWGRLLRLPNLCTAVADVAAGLALAGGPIALGRGALLLAAGPCLYAGGGVLNDWFDRHLDATERPTRPLPAGEIAPFAALAAGLLLLAAGVLLGRAAGRIPGAIAAAIALAALAYDAGLKRQAVASTVAIALCRLLDVGLGIAATPVGHGDLLLALPLAWYVAAVMPLSRVEVKGGPRWAPLTSLVLLMASAATGGFLVWARLFALTGGVAIATVATAAGLCLLPPLVDPSPVRLQQAISRILLGIIPLDAALCLGGERPWVALPILLLFLPARALARRIAMT